MKPINLLWMGTEEAFERLHALEMQYLAVEPRPEQLARGTNDEGEVLFDVDFGVRADRIGLPLLERFGSTAVIKVHGSLVSSHRWWHEFYLGDIASYEAINDAIEIAVKAEGVTRLVLDCATGGGHVRGIDSVSRKLKWAKGFLEVAAHTDSHAFSAGYWIAASASRLTASRMAELGSIGTLLITYTMVKAAEKEGYEYHVFRAGEQKALGNPYEELSDEAKKVIQSNLDKSNTFFLEHVAQHRKLSISSKGIWAEGKTFYAEEALSVGLIDQVANLDDVLGSGASQTSTSDDFRRFEMNIPAEKLAQITAGADPKDVLTAEELKFYTTQLEAEAAGSEGEDEAPAEPQAVEGAEGENKPEATASAQAAELMDLARQVGQLEARLEEATARGDRLQAKLEERDDEINGLAEVAKVALGNLCTALGKPKEIPASASSIVAKFTELQGEMAARFRTGQSSRTDIQDPEEKARALAKSFRHNL